MRISATGRAERWPQRAGGFSLIEVMVVLVIIALAASAVMLALPGAEARVRRDAEQLAARLAAARSFAVTGNASVAAVITADGYRFERSAGDRWLASPRPEGARWSREVTALLQPPGAARVRFDSIGYAEPARITLSAGAAQRTVIIARGGKVRLADAR